MDSLINRIKELTLSRKTIELTFEELECLFKVIELSAELEALETTWADKEAIIRQNKEELERILKADHFKGLEDLLIGF